MKTESRSPKGNVRMIKPLFDIQSTSSSPKYKQIVNGIISAIERKELMRGDLLPSVSQICKEFSLSRETVVKAYAELKSQGIVEAVPRKGYYVASEYIKHETRVFVLFDAFTPYKQDLYNSFQDELGEDAILDIYFHHFNIELFESLLLDSMGKYGIYLIMPFPHSHMSEIFAKLNPERLLVLDRSYLLVLDREKQYAGSYSYIGQNFNTALYTCLQTGLSLIKKYKRIVLVFPLPSTHPKEIMDGFSRFCEENKIDHKIIHNLVREKIRKKTVYFVIDDTDLVQIVERCKAKNYILGQDVGVLSYNETAMKRVVSDGITVVSTDFVAMGKRVAEYVRNPKKTQEIVPTRLIVRSSL